MSRNMCVLIAFGFREPPPPEKFARLVRQIDFSKLGDEVNSSGTNDLSTFISTKRNDFTLPLHESLTNGCYRRAGKTKVETQKQSRMKRKKRFVVTSVCVWLRSRRACCSSRPIYNCRPLKSSPLNKYNNKNNRQNLLDNGRGTMSLLT